MATSISRNLSHRRLLKQKNQELLSYHRIAPKTTKNLELKVVDISNTLKDHQTSINLDGSLDTSLSGRLASGKSQKSKGRIMGVPQLKSVNFSRKPNSSGKIKSKEKISFSLQSPKNMKSTFSVKKLSKNLATASQPKLASMENLETQQHLKKNIQSSTSVPRSETDLKMTTMTLKKTTTSKLKLKVKDPFEKRTKLDMEFQDQSMIGRREDSLMSTLNQEDFKQILRKLN